MSLDKELEKINSDLDGIKNILSDEGLKRVKKKVYKLPFGLKFRARRKVKQGKILTLLLRSNHQAEFVFSKFVGGIIRVNGEDFNVKDENAIYRYKRFPLLVIFEWRLFPVGGKAEEVRSRVIGGESDKELAEELGITKDAEDTIIKRIELAELEKADGKKKKKNWVWIIIIGVIVVYLFLYLLGVV